MAHGKIYICFALCLSFVSWAELSQTPDLTTPVTNGPVYALAQTSDTIFLGGSFTYIGPWTGGGVPFNASTLLSGTPTPLANHAKVDGSVYVGIPDGSGGWYIGGDFTTVGGEPHANLAHILPDGAVDAAWTPSTDNVVSALALHGGVLYVGGYFTEVNGVARSRAAALNADTGALLPWNPAPNNYVAALLVLNASGTDVIVLGGGFTNVGGTARQYLAVVDPTTAQLTPFSPNPNNDVTALAAVPNGFVVAGYFSTISGESRYYVARYSLDGTLLPGAPNPNGPVYTLLPVGADVYIGGGFTIVSGQSRKGVACLSADLATLRGWNPNAGDTGQVRSIAKVDDRFLIGGSFSSMGGQPRKYFAVVDENGAVQDSILRLSSEILTIVPSGSSVYIGGNFASCGGYACSNLAAIDTSTWTVKPFFPQPNDYILALTARGNDLYVGGGFTNISGPPAKVGTMYLAKVNATTGAVSSTWRPQPDQVVRALALGNDALFVGGSFTVIGGQSRNRIAALDLDTGEAKAWNPGANGDVFTLLTVDSTVYVGGAFTVTGSIAQPYLAAVNAVNGVVVPNLFPGINAPVYALAYANNALFVGGDFTGLTGGRNRFVAFDMVNGGLTPMVCNVDGSVYAIVPYGDKVFIGGRFTQINGEFRRSLAAVQPNTGALATWAPNTDLVSDLFAMTMRNGVLSVGGNFIALGGSWVSNFATFSGETPQEGTITVDVTPDTASWRLTGPPNFEGNGFVYTGDRTFVGAFPGTYTFAPEPLAGYVSPTTQQGNLTAGGSLTFSKRWYQTGTVVVNVTPDTATWTLSGPAEFSGNGSTYSGDQTFTNAPVGSYTWTGNALSGYTTPPTQTLTLSAGGTITFTKTWTASGGGGGGGTGGSGCAKALQSGTEGSPENAAMPSLEHAVLMTATGGLLTLIRHTRKKANRN